MYTLYEARWLSLSVKSFSYVNFKYGALITKIAQIYSFQKKKTPLAQSAPTMNPSGLRRSDRRAQRKLFHYIYIYIIPIYENYLDFKYMEKHK